MSQVAAIGASADVAGFALAGVRVYPAEAADDVRACWLRLPPQVAVVFLTAAAADVLADVRTAPDAPMSVVIPG